MKAVLKKQSLIISVYMHVVDQCREVELPGLRVAVLLGCRVGEKSSCRVVELPGCWLPSCWVV